MKVQKIYLKPDDVVIIYVLFLAFYNLVNVAAFLISDLGHQDMIEGLFYASFLGSLISLACFLILSRLIKRLIIRWIYFLIIALIVMEAATFVLIGRSFLFVLFSNLISGEKNTVVTFLALNNFVSFLTAVILRVVFIANRRTNL